MNGSRRKFRESLRALSRREQIILSCVLGLLVLFVADFLFNTLYLERKRALEAEVTQAEERVRHHQRLLSREEMIHAQYKRLESPGIAVQDSALSETEILRELSDMAGRTVHVKSVVPRLGDHEGRQVVFVAMDLEGPFTEVVAYVEKILNEMPSEVSSLSMATVAGQAEAVVCRLSIRVACYET